MKFIQTYAENEPDDYISVDLIERFSLHSWNPESEENPCITVMARQINKFAHEGWCVSPAFDDWDLARYFMRDLIHKINGW